MTPTEVAHAFYQSMARRDTGAMARFYDAQSTFSDPAFPALKGSQVPSMWSGLLSRASDAFSVSYEVKSVNGNTVEVHWVATYPFSRTGRQVVNRITSHLTVEGDVIRAQKDEFDFWAWSRMAFGPVGMLLGWAPFFQKKVQREAARVLKA